MIRGLTAPSVVMLTDVGTRQAIGKETPGGREELRAKSLVGLEVILCMKISDGFVTESRIYEDGALS